MSTMLSFMNGLFHALVVRGGVLAVFAICAVIGVWFALVTMLISSLVQGLKFRRWLAATAAGVGLVLMMTIAEFSVFTLGADLASQMTSEQP